MGQTASLEPLGMLIVFHVTVGHLFVFGEMSIVFSAHILIGLFFSILSYVSSFTLEIIPLVSPDLANIFSGSICCLFLFCCWAKLTFDCVPFV